MPWGAPSRTQTRAGRTLSGVCAVSGRRSCQGSLQQPETGSSSSANTEERHVALESPCTRAWVCRQWPAFVHICAAKYVSPSLRLSKLRSGALRSTTSRGPWSVHSSHHVSVVLLTAFVPIL